MSDSLDYKNLIELKPAIEKSLMESTVNNNNSLDIEILSGLNEIESCLKPNNRIRLENMISDNPVRDFIFPEIYYQLRAELPYIENKENVPLTSIEIFSDTNSLADELITKINKPTAKYKVFFNLGDVGRYLSPFVNKGIAISDNIDIICLTDEQINNEYKAPHSKSNNKYFEKDFQLQPNVAYLQICYDGYLSYFGGPTKQKLYDLFKEILVILNSYCIVSVSARQNNDNNQFIAFKEKSKDNYIFHDYFYIESISHTPIPRIEIHSVFKGWDKNYQDDYLHSVCKLFPVYFNLKDKVKCAARWLMNSYLIENQLLQYILAITAIETLLGDQNTGGVGIKNLIANRLAYAIGTSDFERSEIISSFVDIYKTRCKIVHDGCEKLTEDEIKNLDRLRYYIHCYIQYEIKLHIL
ncbi:HEPN domain-containing protein [Legionella fallonii]|uniref:Uncharacterized protein n=1 Tax=Legionella fallonii LLAP-10 TaxID=1212491 RepID=A0A098G5Z2_9GAMM|nr:HEPN domain-containing protein [Legionella fallonii]CEG57872.1 protein of unknown function [Legionella fallonii LLAP-10]